MSEAIADKKSKRKKEPNLYEFYEKLMLMNNDNFLFSIDEVKTMMRMDRGKFVDSYIKTKKIPVTVLENGKTMIRNLDLKLYLDQQQRIYQEVQMEYIFKHKKYTEISVMIPAETEEDAIRMLNLFTDDPDNWELEGTIDDSVLEKEE